MKAKVKKSELEITLTLNEKEATALLAITGSIGGLPTGSRGVFSDTRGSLRTTLAEALGFDYQRARSLAGFHHGSIRFSDLLVEDD